MATSNSPFPPSPDKRLPFKGKSLPQAGESLQELAEDLVFNKSLAYAFAAIAFAFVAVAEFVVDWFKEPLSPWTWVLASVASAAIAAWRWYKIKPQLAALKQGVRGEREVGRMLEETREMGYVVFHDIPGNGFNVDHALIGPGGVFAIETKTLSKPRGRRAEVDFDGERVRIDGHTPERDPVAQAQASAAHLRDLLKRTTGRHVHVHPVVLFPGWMVKRAGGQRDSMGDQSEGTVRLSAK